MIRQSNVIKPITAHHFMQQLGQLFYWPIFLLRNILGTEIYPSLNRIVKHNYAWANLPKSLQAKVSLIKMNVLPRIKFHDSSLPASCLLEQASDRSFQIYMERKMPSSQGLAFSVCRLYGGLAIPNFKVYYWSFIHRPLITWFESRESVLWCAIEEQMVHPWSLLYWCIICKHISEAMSTSVWFNYSQAVKSLAYCWKIQW